MMRKLKRQRDLVIGALIGIVSLSVGSALAAVTVSYDTAIPTNYVLTSFAPATVSGYQWRDNENTERDLGQSFFASSDTTMASFSLLSDGNLQTGAKSAPFTVEIYESSVDDAIGSVVSTQGGIFLANDNAGSIDGAWLTFDIDDIVLTGGNYYTFILSFDNPDVQDQDQTFGLFNGSGYADGRLWQSNEGAAFASSTVNDFAFVVQSDLPIVVPKVVEVSYDAAIPTNDVLISFVPTTVSGYAWRDNESSERDFGQSFLATSDVVMDSFSLQANGNLQNGAKNAAFTVDLYESATDGTIGSVVESYHGNYLANDDAGSITGTWVTFDVEDISLSLGKYYTFTLSFDNAGVQDQDQVFSLSSEGYAAGRFWQANAGAAFASSTVNDAAFVVQIVPGVAVSGYEAWADGYVLVGNDALPGTDIEPDGFDNLMEYALGGNPTNDDSVAIAPVSYLAVDGGTNYFYYIHNERTDDSTLGYTLGVDTDLVNAPSWDTNDVFVVGESASVDNYKIVTNRTEAAPNTKFIRLTVEN